MHVEESDTLEQKRDIPRGKKEMNATSFILDKEIIHKRLHNRFPGNAGNIFSSELSKMRAKCNVPHGGYHGRSMKRRTRAG